MQEGPYLYLVCTVLHIILKYPLPVILHFHPESQEFWNRKFLVPPVTSYQLPVKSVVDFKGILFLFLKECAVDEMADFPRRMRDWLFNIMRDLADRKELSEYYLKMEREAESNLTRRWTNAAIWKWCDLDALDNDR